MSLNLAEIERRLGDLDMIIAEMSDHHCEEMGEYIAESLALEAARTRILLRQQGKQSC